jgi:hypothetical protein
MTFSFSDFSAALRAGAPITAEDVIAVRRAVWPDGAVSDEEAESLFELHRLARDPGPEWAAFFIEAMCEHVVNSQAPRGYVDDKGATWLIGEIERDDQSGAADARAAIDLDLVAKVIDTALNCPPSLKSWALGRIEAAVARDRRVGGDEVKLLRRIVFASGGDGALTVSQDEADALWRIKDICLDSENDPGWKTLFVQAVANHLMAFSSYRPLERNEAARLEAFVNDRSSSVLGFLGRVLDSNLGDGLKQAPRDLLDKGPSAEEHDKAVAEANAIVPEERSWLDGRIEADGARDPYEGALLAFIEEESKPFEA